MKNIAHPAAESEEEFVTGKRVIRQEQRVEDENKALTDLRLDSDPLLARALQMYENLGTAISLLTQMSTCRWGCRGGDHDIENLLRRFCNSTFASLRLMVSGLYDEALGPARGMAELINLLQVFCIDASYLAQWKQISPKQRLAKFSPVQVRKTIERHGHKPLVTKEVYAKLCENGIHVSPTSIYISHEYEDSLYVGGNFAIPGLLLILSRLSHTVAPCLVLGGKLVNASKEKMKILAETARKLIEEAYSWDVTDYEEFFHKFRAQYTRELVLQELSTISEQEWQEYVGKLVPDLTNQDDLDKMTEQEIEEIVFPLIYERMAQRLIQRSREQTQRWSVEAARDAFVKQVMDMVGEVNKHDSGISTNSIQDNS